MRILLILMAVASLGMANPANAGEEWQNNPQPAHMSDARMKALLTGAWNAGNGVTYTFTPDGRWFITDPKFPDEPDDPHWKWNIQNGVLIQIRTPAADRPYTIVFLTRHECLIFAGHHEQGYFFWWR